MKSKKIISLIKNSQTITTTDVKVLDDLLLQYPYFQNGHLLLTKGLLNSDSVRYNKELKKTAAYCLDRKKLFNLITKNKSNEINYNTDEDILPKIYKGKINNWGTFKI